MLLAEGLLEFANGKMGQFQQTLGMGMVIVGICMIIATYVKTKAMVPTLGAILLAGIAAFAGTGGMDVLQGKIADEANSGGGAVVAPPEGR